MEAVESEVLQQNGVGTEEEEKRRARRSGREKLADIASSVSAADKVNDFKKLLQYPSQGHPNGGVAVTNDLKYTSVFDFVHILFYH